MSKRDIIVVGASAGGIAPLKAFVASLPAGFGGSVFIVLHIPPYSQSHLANILNGAGPLPAVHPTDGQSIEPGTIYVATNDHHLLVEEGRILVKRGPRENRNRPSIDALFRSAAYTYRERVVGIILSGMLDDGTSGLWSVKRMGGVTVIQDPGDAEHPQMPQNVLGQVEVDHVVPAAAIGPLLVQLMGAPPLPAAAAPTPEEQLLKTEVLIAARHNAFEMGMLAMGQFTPFTCPECHGALVRLKEGQLLRFRCHTGHAYTASALLTAVSESVEELLWQSVRSLEDTRVLLEAIAGQYEELQLPEAAALFRQKAAVSGQQARYLQRATEIQQQFSEDIRFEKPASDTDAD